MRRLLLILMLFLLSAAAAGVAEGLEFYDITDEDRLRVLERLSLVAVEEEYADLAIECFDVRGDGMIALWFERPRGGKYVAVLKPDGAFAYGFAFQGTGSFLLDWMEDGLGIIRVRGAQRIVVDEAGSCIRLESMKTNTALSRYENALREPVRRHGDTAWLLRNDHPLSFLAVHYGRLVRIDAQGNESILHDASFMAAGGSLMVAVVILFVVACVIVDLRKRRPESIDKPLNS